MHKAVWGMAKCERVFAVLGPAVRRPPRDREPRARGGRHRRFEDVRSGTGRATRPRSDGASRSGPARPSRSSVRRAPGRRRSRRCCCGSSTREAGTILLGGVRCPTSTPRIRRTLRAGAAGHVPVPRHGRREPRAGPAGRHDDDLADARGRRAPPRSSRGCPKGSTRSSASAASGCPAASGSASRSRARC